IVDPETLSEQRHIPLTTASPGPLAFDPRGQYLAESQGQSVAIHGLEDGRLLQTLQCGAGVISLCFDPSGRIIAVGGKDGIVRLFEVETGQQLLTLPGRADLLGFSSDGSRLTGVGITEGQGRFTI